MRMDMPGGGKLMHACLRFGDSAVMLADEFPDWNSLGPNSRGGTSVTLHLYVPDADAFFEKAIKAGAEVVMPLGDAFWGDRYGQLKDPFGHVWSVATHVKDLTPEEIAEAAKTAMSEGCGDK
ncbi:MAG: VOC family protein [Thermodesulfobacteriota bacterium]